MKAILEFNLPEETEEHESALNGGKYKAEIENFSSKLRTIVKYEFEFKEFITWSDKAHLTDSQRSLIISYTEWIRKELWEICENSLRKS